MSYEKIRFTKKPIQELNSDILFSYTNTDFLPMKVGVFNNLIAIDPSLVTICAHANVKTGTAIVLGAGNLPYKSICHFIIAGMGNDSTETSIRNAMRWGFQIVSENRYPKYVLPALFEDAGGMSCRMCAEIVLREIIIFANNSFVSEILIQTKNPKELSEYKAVFKKFNTKNK